MSSDYYKRNRERLTPLFRASHLRRSYGMYLEDYEILFKKQGGVCKVCGSESKQKSKKFGTTYHLHIDHCHKTGKVRGLLCARCNRGLGTFGDNVDLIGRAYKYMKKYG